MNANSGNSVENNTQIYVTPVNVGLDKNIWLKDNPEPLSWIEWNEKRLLTFMVIDQLAYEQTHDKEIITIDFPHIKYMMEYGVRSLATSLLVSMKYIYPTQYTTQTALQVTSTIFPILAKYSLASNPISNVLKTDVLEYITKLVDARYAAMDCSM